MRTKNSITFSLVSIVLLSAAALPVSGCSFESADPSDPAAWSQEPGSSSGPTLSGGDSVSQVEPGPGLSGSEPKSTRNDPSPQAFAGVEPAGSASKPTLDDPTPKQFAGVEPAIMPQGAIGDGCGADWECSSGFCADGYCCSSACDGADESCSVEPGRCVTYPEGSNQ